MRSLRPFQPGGNCSSIASGTQMSGDSPTVVPKNSLGATPIIVYEVLSMVMVLPITEGSPANLRRHQEWLATTTGCPPGVISSSEVSVRPRMGFTPSTEKYVPETICALICSSSPPD